MDSEYKAKLLGLIPFDPYVEFEGDADFIEDAKELFTDLDGINKGKDKLDKMGEQYEKYLNRKFLKILKAKREQRDKIFKNDENLKTFLSLWQNHRSSEIIMKKLM